MFDPWIPVLSQMVSTTLTLLVLMLQIGATIDWLQSRRRANGLPDGIWLIWLLPIGSAFYFLEKERRNRKKMRTLSLEAKQEQQEWRRPYQEGYQAERSMLLGVASSAYSPDQPQASYPELSNQEQPLGQR